MFVCSRTRTYYSVFVKSLSIFFGKDKWFFCTIPCQNLLSCWWEIGVICSRTNHLLFLCNFLWTFWKLMRNSWIILGSFALSIHIYLLYDVFITKKIHAPGPGVMLYGQSLGNLSLGLIVIFFMFSLSCWSWYCPGPGLLVWLKMEIEWQFYRLSPMERPCFGPLLNSDGNVYLSGDGELFFLDMM